MTIHSTAEIKILDRRNQEIGIYPNHLAELLEKQPRSSPGIGELDRLHRERSRLLCKCGRVLQVVQREFPFLRRNPHQAIDGPECTLCKGSREYGVQIKETSTARRIDGINLILATRNHLDAKPPESSEPGDTQNTIKTRTSLKYVRGFSTIFTLISRAGFTSLQTTLSWD
jgi:hypothetical protein